MQPIGINANQNSEKQAVLDTTNRGLILPRILRKPVRQMLRLLNGGFRVSRAGLVVFGLAFAGAALIAGVIAGNKSGLLAHNIAKSLGVVVSTYEISGNREAGDGQIIQVLANIPASSILTYDVDKARTALKALSWIKNATVSKVYPDKLSVKIVERKAFALWQSDDGLKIVDHKGLVLADFDGRDHSLPLVVGKGGNENAETILTLLNEHAWLATQAKALVRVGNRRWDIVLDNDMTIMLPEKGAGVELARLHKIESESQILSKDISKIDLRFSDRLIVKMSPQASEFVQNKRGEQLKVIKASTKERNT